MIYRVSALARILLDAILIVCALLFDKIVNLLASTPCCHASHYRHGKIRFIRFGRVGYRILFETILLQYLRSDRRLFKFEPDVVIFVLVVVAGFDSDVNLCCSPTTRRTTKNIYFPTSLHTRRMRSWLRGGGCGIFVELESSECAWLLEYRHCNLDIDEIRWISRTGECHLVWVSSLDFLIRMGVSDLVQLELICICAQRISCW